MFDIKIKQVSSLIKVRNIEDFKETINLVTKPKKKTKNSNTKKTKTVKGRKNAKRRGQG